MSVEKYTVTKEDSFFTTLPNVVLQNTDNLEALGLWCYLQSMPPSWIFHQSVLKSFFNIGRDKFEKLISILKKLNLVEISRTRNEKGQLKEWHLHVKGGHEYPCPKNTGMVKKPDAVYQGPVNQGLVTATYKRNTIQIKDFKKKTKSSYKESKIKETNKKKHDFADSMNQNACEKKQIEEHEKIKRTPMPENLRQLYKSIKA